MNDQDIVASLLARDPFVTKLFFYRNCRPLFVSLAQQLSQGTRRWEYDEIVSEIYALLMEDDGRRLRTFGFTCSLYQWIKVVALHHLASHGNLVIDTCSRSPLYDYSLRSEEDAPDAALATDDEGMLGSGDDLDRLLGLMPNRRYAEVIRKLVVEGYGNEELAREMGVRIANLYNIKRRAMTMLGEVATRDRRLYRAKVSPRRADPEETD